MSIKQNGGVFGRNPTFNDVTIEGDLIINGEVFSGLDFQGSWNASTNTPALASGTGTKGEFYIVSVAGTTNLDGITNWGIGDWALFNGTVWQRVEGGADGNFNALTANTLLVNGDATITGGDLVIGTSGNGIDFSATAGTGTSELLDDYEEGTWTATPVFASGTPSGAASGSYTKIGNLVSASVYMGLTIGTGSGIFTITGLPYTVGQTTAIVLRTAGVGATGTVLQGNVVSGGTTMGFQLAPQSTSLAGASVTAVEINSPDSYWQLSVTYKV